jgi:hypothetical protein
MSETEPVIVWHQELNATLLVLPPGTPSRILDRISAREWTSPGG